jgi:ParB-like chromosome segregation protein Spo0J
MPEYGIVNHGNRYEVLGGGRRVAVFDSQGDAELFVKIKEGKAEALVEALRTIYDDIAAKNFSRTTFGEYRGGALLGDLAMEHAETALREWKEKQP